MRFPYEFHHTAKNDMLITILSASTLRPLTPNLVFKALVHGVKDPDPEHVKTFSVHLSIFLLS